MNTPWTAAGIWLFHSAVGGGLLMLLTWILMRRTPQPAKRQRLGEFGVIAALAVAVLSLGPAWLIVSWPAAAPAQPPVAAPEPTPEPVVFHFQVLEARLPFIGQPWVGPHWEMGVAAAAVPPKVDPQPQTSVETSESLDWREVAIAGFVCAFVVGAGWTLGRWLFGWMLLGRLLGRARRAPADVADLFDDLNAGRLRARLLVSGWLRVPVSCGLWHPTVLVPAGLCAPSHRAKLRWVLAHELTHLERRDAWSCLLFGIGQAFFFYLPWFWSIRRQVRLCQEYVADAAAVSAFGDDTENADGVRASADYAEFLLSLTTAPAVPLATTGVSGNKSDLFRRVSMLLEQPVRVERRCPRRWTVFAAGTLLALGVSVAGIGVRAEANDVIIITTGQAKVTDHGGVKVIVVPAGAEKELRDVIIQRIDGKKSDAAKREMRIEIEKKNGDAAKKEIKWQFFSPEGKAVIVNPPDLESVRKTLQKLEKDGVLKKEQLEEVLKALEKAGKTGRSFQFRFNPMPGGDSSKGDADVKKAREIFERAIQIDPKEIRVEVQKALEQAGVPPARHMTTVGSRHGVGGKLGIRAEAPSAILIDQLSLPKQHGVVIVEVKSDSPAAKAGLKVNDLILKIDGQIVTSEPAALGKLLGELKPGANVGVIVLRKGKQHTVEGLVIPEGVRVAPVQGGIRLERGVPALPGVPGAPANPPAQGAPAPPGAPAVPAAPGVPAAQAEKTVRTSTTRTGDRFTTRHEEGSLTITLAGTIAGGRAKAAEITIQDGNTTGRYDDVGSVPAKYREKVHQLLRLSAGGTTRVESR